MWISARPESYSNMPTSKMPTTVNCLRRGSTAAGVTMPCGAISVTLSPMPTLQRARQFRAENDAEFAGCRSSKRPDLHVLAKSATFSSASGRMPRTIVPRTCWSRASMPCAWT